MMKAFTIFYSLIFIAVSSLFAGTYSGGDGSSGNPYKIANLNDLSELCQTSGDWAAGKYFIQTADIDASQTQYWDDSDDNSDGDLYNDPNDATATGTNNGFSPIGNSTTNFRGSYNGQNYTIDGLYINRTNIIGLFGQAGGPSSVIIKNLGVTNANISGSSLVGALIGYNQDNVTVSNCYSSGSVLGTGNVGGLIGKSDGSFFACSINECYSSADVHGYTNNSFGGLVGYNSTSSTISNCYSVGDVTRETGSTTDIGAFCGKNASTIEHCYSTGGVFYTGTSNPTDKGFVGTDVSGTYTNNFFDNELSNQTTGAGAAAKTTTQMQTTSTFTDAGWDFVGESANGTNDYWNRDDTKNNKYPFLTWQATYPLPVELSLFTAVLNGDEVTLSWRTETEVNNYGFEIERKISLNSSSNTPLNPLSRGDFETIGFVQGYGNSNSPKEYSFIDAVELSGTIQYRLKQIDTDGSFEYSKIVEIELSAPEKFELMQNYPNPFNPATTIKYTIPSSGNNETIKVKLTVYDALGAEVSTLVNKNQSAGRYSVKFDASSIGSGVYIYKLRAGDFRAVKKMILLR